MWAWYCQAARATASCSALGGRPAAAATCTQGWGSLISLTHRQVGKTKGHSVYWRPSAAPLPRCRLARPGQLRRVLLNPTCSASTSRSRSDRSRRRASCDSTQPAGGADQWEWHGLAACCCCGGGGACLRGVDRLLQPERHARAGCRALKLLKSCVYMARMVGRPFATKRPSASRATCAATTAPTSRTVLLCWHLPFGGVACSGHAVHLSLQIETVMACGNRANAGGSKRWQWAAAETAGRH